MVHQMKQAGLFHGELLIEIESDLSGRFRFFKLIGVFNMLLKILHL